MAEKVKINNNVLLFHASNPFGADSEIYLESDLPQKYSKFIIQVNK